MHGVPKQRVQARSARAAGGGDQGAVGAADVQGAKQPDRGAVPRAPLRRRQRPDTTVARGEGVDEHAADRAARSRAEWPGDLDVCRPCAVAERLQLRAAQPADVRPDVPGAQVRRRPASSRCRRPSRLPARADARSSQVLAYPDRSWPGSARSWRQARDRAASVRPSAVGADAGPGELEPTPDPCLRSPTVLRSATAALAAATTAMTTTAASCRGPGPGRVDGLRHRHILRGLGTGTRCSTRGTTRPPPLTGSGGVSCR